MCGLALITDQLVLFGVATTATETATTTAQKQVIVIALAHALALRIAFALAFALRPAFRASNCRLPSSSLRAQSPFASRPRARLHASSYANFVCFQEN